MSMLAIFLLLGCVTWLGEGCSTPEHCALEAELTAWQSVILNQVSTMPKQGIPGTAFVFGERAFPIVMGKRDQDVIMAAAELGLGRVVAVTMNNYVKDFTDSEPEYGQLLNNLKIWLTKGTYIDDSCICYLKYASDFDCLDDPNIKIVTSTGSDWPTVAQTDQLTQWIRDGGALFHGTKGWVWKTYSTSGKAGKPITEGIGFYGTLLEAGIGYTTYLAQSLKPIPTPQDASAMMGLNVKVAAELVTSPDDMVGNSFLSYILDLIRSTHARVFPNEVKQLLGSALQPAADICESQMVWPSGSVDNVVSTAVTKGQQGMFELYFALGSIGLWYDVAPNAELFPGTVENPPERSTVSVEYTSDRKSFFPTGYYLLPGETLTITILSTSDPSWKNFKVLIGSHTDKLYNKNSLKRWPEIASYVSLFEETTVAKSMFGGLVFFTRSNSDASYIQASISGVIPAPYFNLADPNASADWETQRNNPAPWAIVSGIDLFITLPSSSIRTLPDPTDIMQTWDELVSDYHNLTCKPDAQKRTQWFGIDIQISIGYMHSGYPIGAHLVAADSSSDKFFLQGNWPNYWGYFHEIGHNMQNKYWTYSGALEVTVNIFSSFAMETLAGQAVWMNNYIGNKVHGSTLTNWLNEPTFAKLKSSAGTGILVYGQLLRDFGWSCMKKFFCDFTLDEEAGQNLPQNNQQEMDQWVTRYSSATGYNVAPLFDFWQFPLSASVYQEVSGLQPYLPDDEVTQRQEATPLVDEVVATYPDLLRYNPDNSPPLTPLCQEN